MKLKKPERKIRRYKTMDKLWVDSKSSMLALYAFRADLERRLF